MGEFKTRTLKLGEVYLEMLEDLTDLNSRFGHSAPARAMFHAFQVDKYDHDRLIKKLSFVPETMVNLYGKVPDILRSVEDIYNYKQQSDIVRFY